MQSACVSAQPPMRLVVWGAALASAAFLSFALVSQYGFGLFPCELCLAQRVPYALILLLGGVAAAVRRPKLLSALAAACALLFAADAGIAGYHAGVERHWFPGPSACTASTEAQTLEEMRRAILEAELVSCDQPMAYMLGLSMAEWNGIAASASALLTLWGMRRAQRKARA